MGNNTIGTPPELQQSNMDSQSYTSLDDGSSISLRDGGLPGTNVTGIQNDGSVTVYDRSRNEHHRVAQFDNQGFADDFIEDWKREMQSNMFEDNHVEASPGELERLQRHKDIQSGKRSPFRSWKEQQ